MNGRLPRGHFGPGPAERYRGTSGGIVSLAASLVGHAVAAALFLTRAPVLIDPGQAIVVEIVAVAPGFGQAAQSLNATATRMAEAPADAAVKSEAAAAAVGPPAPAGEPRDEQPPKPGGTVAGTAKSPAEPRDSAVADEQAETAETRATAVAPVRREAAGVAEGVSPRPPSAAPVQSVAATTTSDEAEVAPDAESASLTTGAGDGMDGGSAPIPVGGNPRPAYPPRAIRLGIEGQVLLTVEVLPEGDVASVAVGETSGHPILDRAALDAVRHWRFKPALRLGRPVRARVTVPVAFRLTE